MKIRHLITALLTTVLAFNVTVGPASAIWWEDITEESVEQKGQS
jgi:hypothetical protein